MTLSSSLSNLPKLTGEKDSDGKYILPIADGKYVIRILRLGKIGGEIEWFDFEQVPQGYIHVCGSSVRKPKGTRMKKTEHIDGSIINPTDDQIIDQAKRMMVRNDLYGQNSGKNPEDFIFVVEKPDV
jgi:hypothetical protein